MPKNPDIIHQEETGKKLAVTATYRTEIGITESSHEKQNLARHGDMSHPRVE
jgi:hypothetical protein